MYSKLAEIINKSHSAAIFMHINPDGDCVSSALSMYTFLFNKQKSPYVFSPSLSEGGIPAKFAFLHNFDKIDSSAPLDAYDLGIIVDCADIERLSEENLKILTKCKTRVAIDHHESHTQYAALDLVEPRAASTTQLLYKVYNFIDGSCIDVNVAGLLYAGLVSDTGCFAYNSVTKESFETATELIGRGIDSSEITRRIFKDIRLPVYNLKNRILSKTKFYRNQTIGVITFESGDFIATGTTEADTEGIVQSVLNVSTVELAVAISEIKNKSFKISFRSKKFINVCSLAKCFGGGGHKFASGCRMNGYLEDILYKILSAAEEMFEHD